MFLTRGFTFRKTVVYTDMVYFVLHAIQQKAFIRDLSINYLNFFKHIDMDIKQSSYTLMQKYKRMNVILVEDIPLCYITITLCSYSLAQQPYYYALY